MDFSHPNVTYGHCSYIYQFYIKLVSKKSWEEKASIFLLFCHYLQQSELSVSISILNQLHVGNVKLNESLNKDP